MAPEFIKVPEKVTVREHDSAKFLVKVIGQPKPKGELVINITFLQKKQKMKQLLKLFI